MKTNQPSTMTADPQDKAIQTDPTRGYTTKAGYSQNPRRPQGIKKRKKVNPLRIGVFLACLAIVCAGLYLLISFIAGQQLGDGKTSGSSSSAGSSASSSAGSSSVVSEVTEFWGDTVDFATAILPVKGTKSLMKWPAEAGFPIVPTDISSYLSKEKSGSALHGITVILDPGHGGEDLGAVYPRAPIKPEIIESRINLTVAKLVKEKLESLGAKVVMTRTDDTFNKLYYRSAVAAKAVLTDFYNKLSPTSKNRSVIEAYLGQMDLTIEKNNDDDKTGWFYGLGVRRENKNILDIEAASTDFLFLAIHCNSSETPDTLHGTTVYYATNKVLYNDEATIDKDIIFPEYQFYNDSQRARFATLLYDNITQYNTDMVPDDPANAIKQRNYSVIREQNLVSALVEMGYVNSAEDRALLLDHVKQGKIAESITNAIYEYYCTK